MVNQASVQFLSLIGSTLLLSVPAIAQSSVQFAAVVEQEYGSANGGLELTRIGDVIVASDGTLLVAQPRDHSVLVVSESGTVVQRIGRSGRGPGEFLYPHALALSNDKLFVSDRGARRGSLFDRTGQLLNTFAPPQYDYPRPLLPDAPEGLLPDGRLLVLPRYIDSGGTPQSLPLLAINPVDGSGSEIARLDWQAPNVRMEIPGTVYLFAPRPITFESLWDLSPTSDRIAVLDRPQPASDTASFSVTLMTSTGDTLWKKRFRYRPIKVSDDDRQRLSSALAGRVTEPVKDQLSIGSARLAATFERELPFTTYFAPADRMVLGREHRVWLRIGNPVTENRWLILGSTGGIVGEVRLPMGTNVATASRDVFWATTEEKGWPQVIRYRLVAR